MKVYGVMNAEESSKDLARAFLSYNQPKTLTLFLNGFYDPSEVMREGPSMYFPGTDDLCGDYCHGLDIVSPGSSLLICKHRHR